MHLEQLERLEAGLQRADDEVQHPVQGRR
jgi:hypothetical protein